MACGIFGFNALELYELPGYHCHPQITARNNMLPGNKIHFTSLGCARNLVDSEVMLGILLTAGYEAVEQHTQADFLVVNTCGFLAAARQESCDTIQKLVDEKKPGAKVIVAGCMVQKFGEEIRKQFPSVHYFLGSGDMEKILEA